MGLRTFIKMFSRQCIPYKYVLKSNVNTTLDSVNKSSKVLLSYRNFAF